MRRSNWTPSIVPNGTDQTVYLVADDFGKIGRACQSLDSGVAGKQNSTPQIRGVKDDAAVVLG